MADFKVVVVDNGAGDMKIGFATDEVPIIIPNCIFKPKRDLRKAIGDQVDEIQDLSGLHFTRPFDRGYIVNWDCMIEIWNYAFSEKLNQPPSETQLVVTEPLFTPQSIQNTFDEVIFEDFGFLACCTVVPQVLSAIYTKETALASSSRYSPCQLVVDSGFSFTHVVPVFDGHVLNYGVKRLNVGGKLLTNYLKEVVSYRHWNMMDETYLINHVKESLCYVSTNFAADLRESQRRGSENSIRREYVLPDYHTVMRGYVKDVETESHERGSRRKTRSDVKEDQLLNMNNERFSVPEVLFNPIEIGINQGGIVDTILESAMACPTLLRPALFDNIILTGGNMLIPNMKERIVEDLRPQVPDDLDLQVILPKDPSSVQWKGGAIWAQRPEFQDRTITKQEYEEYGQSYLQTKRSLI